MLKYSSNYCSKGNNYILNINYDQKTIKNNNIFSSLCVIQNILQRGNPTKPSTFLMERLGGYFVKEDLRYFSNHELNWTLSIKGHVETQDNPALSFYEVILPMELKEYAFVSKLILPEALINEITGVDNEAFFYNTVDFYIPQCKLVIEIDGAQHKEAINVLKDKERDAYLKSFDINTIRIPVKVIKDYLSGRKDDLQAITKIIYNLCKNNSFINEYKNIISSENYYSENMLSIIYDSIMRFQILTIELLKSQVISLEDEAWTFNIKNNEFEVPYELALEDLYRWLTNILKLQCIQLKSKKFVINKVDGFTDTLNDINIDFSVLKRWDDTVFEDNICFVRADYIDNSNYFKVATGELIEYKFIYEGKDENISILQQLNKDLFGFHSFNNGQLPIIINALSKQDTIGLLPTGSGKSLCYQFSCLLQPAINFVVVPIKSLMYDQKSNLDKKGIVHTNYMSGDQDGEEKERILMDLSQGRYFYLWISPERFQTQAFRDELKNINNTLNLGYAVIDEVHCLSEWGHDFRTSYLNLSKTIRKLCPGMLFLGLTATASKNVLKDILVEFEMRDENVKTILDYTRKELTFKVIQDKDGKKEDKNLNLKELLRKLNYKDKAFEKKGNDSKCGLVFTPHVNGAYGCYGLYNELNQAPFLKGSLGFYSGEVPKNRKIPIMKNDEFNIYKKKIQDEFQNNNLTLLTATKAFGMGVDKPNIRYTFHYGISGSIESFYQEAGRAGRDKKSATCYVLHSKDTIEEEDYEKIFALNTSIKELSELTNKYRFPAGDVMRNLFMALGSHEGVFEECILAYRIYELYCAKNQNIIEVKDVASKGLKCRDEFLKINFSNVQRAIYRLSILGIVKDWVVDGWNSRGKFKLVLGEMDEDSIKRNLTNYIKKYDVEFNIDKLSQARYKKYKNMLDLEDTPIEYRYIFILIQWSYDNIFYARRQSQKNLDDLCDAYFEKGEEYFKEVLEGYFKITESTFVLDYLSNNPDDMDSLFSLLFNSEDGINDMEILQQANLSLTRFLESFRYNTALNYLSGMLGLLLDQYTDNSIKERFRAAFESIILKDEEVNEVFLMNTLELGTYLTEENKDNLAEVLCDYYEDHERIYRSLQDNVSLSRVLDKKLQKLQSIGGRFNG